MSLMMMIILEIVMELALNQVELRVALICYLAIENHHNTQIIVTLRSAVSGDQIHGIFGTIEQVTPQSQHMISQQVRGCLKLRTSG